MERYLKVRRVFAIINTVVNVGGIVQTFGETVVDALTTLLQKTTHFACGAMLQPFGRRFVYLPQILRILLQFYTIWAAFRTFNAIGQHKSS